MFRWTWCWLKKYWTPIVVVLTIAGILFLGTVGIVLGYREKAQETDIHQRILESLERIERKLPD